MSSVVIIIVIALFVFSLVLLAIYMPTIKGEIGETKVALILSTLPKELYRTFNDVIVPTRYGTTQIDHIVVSPFGIFVIETKNYKGLIYGGENAETWTKNMWGNKYSLYNPLKQNKSHVNALEGILNIPINSFVPIVVFSNRARIYVDTEQELIRMRKLKRVIKGYQTQVFTQEQIDDIILKIELARVDEKEAKKEHKKRVQTNIKRKNQAIANGICPRCGGQLILREGRYGKFYGCRNYPKCHYTLKA